MEQELFEYDCWNGDQECRIFYNIVLKVQIGKYPAGTKFDSAAIFSLEENEKLEFYNDDGEPIAAFKLSYKVGEEIV